MKEAYFTTESIETVATDMLSDLPAGYLDRATPPLSHCALLVLDMQRFFLDRQSHAYIPGGPVILAGLNRLIGAFAGCGRPVLYTRHVNTKEGAGRMSQWWRDTISADDKMSQLSGELLIPPGSHIMQKSQYDAFHHTDLETMLTRHHIETVAVGGVMTHLCCETTARAAFTRGFNVIFLADGTATYTAGHHRAALLNLSHGFAHIVTVRTLLNQLAKK